MILKSDVDDIINNINMTLNTLNELSESVKNTKKIINFNGSIADLDGIDFTNIPPTLLLNLLINLANNRIIKIVLELNGIKNLDFIEALEYTEILFSGVHMLYSVEINKNTSFDKNGKVLPIVDDYDVEYPSFEKMSNYIFESNIYDDIKDLIYNLEN